MLYSNTVQIQRRLDKPPPYVVGVQCFISPARLVWPVLPHLEICVVCVKIYFLLKIFSRVKAVDEISLLVEQTTSIGGMGSFVHRQTLRYEEYYKRKMKRYVYCQKCVTKLFAV